MTHKLLQYKYLLSSCNSSFSKVTVYLLCVRHGVNKRWLILSVLIMPFYFLYADVLTDGTM